MTHLSRLAVLVAVLVAVLGTGPAGAQKMVSSTPAHSTTGVAVDIGELNFHFDQDMVTDSWSFIRVKWAKFPPLMGKNDAPWVTPRHCRLQIGKLEPDTIYAVQLNSGSKMGFRAASNRMPLSVTMVMFTTGKAKAGARGGADNPKVGGGKQPEPAGDTTIGGGAEQPVKDTTIGGGNPLSAGGTAAVADRKVMLRASVTDKLVLHRVLHSESRFTNHPKFNRKNTMVFNDTYSPVFFGRPAIIRRAVVTAEQTGTNRETGKPERSTTKLQGVTASLKIMEGGLLALAEGQSVPEEVKGEFLYSPLPEPIPGQSMLPGRHVAIGEQWESRPTALALVLVGSSKAEFTVRFKLVGADVDPDLGYEVARIEGIIQGTAELSEIFKKLVPNRKDERLTGSVSISFVPSLGLVSRQVIKIDLGGYQLEFREDARAVNGTAKQKPAGLASPNAEGK